MHADGQTDRHDGDIVGAFRDYAKALNSLAIFLLLWIHNDFCEVGAGYLKTVKPA
jgi:hypothetical protein